jgi:hypothetical protein
MRSRLGEDIVQESVCPLLGSTTLRADRESAPTIMRRRRGCDFFFIMRCGGGRRAEPLRDTPTVLVHVLCTCTCHMYMYMHMHMSHVHVSCGQSDQLSDQFISPRDVHEIITMTTVLQRGPLTHPDPPPGRVHGMTCTRLLLRLSSTDARRHATRATHDAGSRRCAALCRCPPRSALALPLVSRALGRTVSAYSE